MRNELFPYIENNFKADKNDRTLVGCSLGGLFTMYTLFTQPDLFQRYVAASPAFGWDNDVLSKHEQSYFDKKVTLPARLYMIMGGVERNEPNFEKLVKRLDDRHYTSLQIESRVLENTGHSGTKGEGYARGLQYVFKKPSLQLSAAVLNKYAGNYKTSNGNTLDMKVENNQLVFYAGPNNKFRSSLRVKLIFIPTPNFCAFISKQRIIQSTASRQIAMAAVSILLK
ncbi:MAG: alpha/beta hydrolase-fold protein [Chitinophagaceae bacterium]